VVLPIFKVYDKLPEQYLSDYIRNYSGHLDFVTAEELGRLVDVRRYDKVADRIYEKAKINGEFLVSLRVCHNRLGLVRQMKLFLWGNIDVQITEKKWWAALTELAIELCPYGPDELGLWKRSGGTNSKLLNNRTGEETWEHAISLIRQNRKGAPHLDDFLHELNKEFGGNGKLKIVLSFRKQRFK
jgi:hypothetical protein